MAARPATELDLDELARAHRPRTLCSTNPQTPINEDWDQTIGWSLAPKKTGRQIMMKGGHHEEGMHSVNNILLHGHRPSKHFLGCSYSGSSMYHHFWRNTLQLPRASGLCLCLRNLYIGGEAQLPPLYAILSVTPLRKLPCASGPA